MIGKMLNLAAILALATVLATGGFVAYLFGSGRLNAARVEQIGAVLRGEHDAAPTSQPATEQAAAPATQPADPPPAHSSAQEVRGRQREEALTSLRLERATADLEAQRRLLDQIMQSVVQEQERLNEERETFAAHQKKAASTSEDAGFKKEVDYVSGLKPSQAKEYIIRVWQKQKADAVRLFTALEDARAKRILEQFKTAPELQVMTDLLEQIRLQGTTGHAMPSGTTAGDAAP